MVNAYNISYLSKHSFNTRGTHNMRRFSSLHEFVFFCKIFGFSNVIIFSLFITLYYLIAECIGKGDTTSLGSKRIEQDKETARQR
jgi:hypothetical protein